MLTSNSLRWLVVVTGAAMLLAFVAACAGETVEVPGETVVVEKVVVQEVPGKKYVTDPTTGKAVSAPQYGGTITHHRQNS